MANNFSAVGLEVQVNTNADREEFDPDVAVLSDGRFFVTYERSIGGDVAIRGQFVNADGTLSGGLVRIDFTATLDSIDPAVAAFGAGGAIVVYGDDDGGREIRFRLIDSAGTVGAEQTALQGTVLTPDIAALADGRSLIVGSSVTSSNNIAFRFVDATGAPLGVADLLDDDAGNQFQSAIASFGNNALVVYRDDQDAANDIVARFYDGSGETTADFAPEVIVGNIGNLFEPDVAALADGRFIVVWSNDDNDDVEGRLVDAAGNPIGSVFTIDSSGGDDDGPRVAGMPDGGFIVTWANDGGNLAPEISSNNAVFARRFDSSGAAAGDVFLVNAGDPATDQDHPAIAVNRTTGQAFIAWEDDHDFSSTGGDSIPPDIRGHAFLAITDVINGTPGNDILSTYGLGEQINGLEGDDTISAFGGSDLIAAGAGNDIVDGGAGDDAIDAGPGDDGLNGGPGNDLMLGGNGNDHLNGGEGNDLLVGGKGRDKQFGGLGADKFDFNKLSESKVGAALRDFVKDFRHGEHDRIDLKDIDADTDGNPGNQKFKFIGSDAFSGTDRELRVFNGIVQGDTNGDGIANFEIKVLTGGPALVAGDFFL